MGTTQGWILLYHRIFIGCLVGALFFLAVAIVLFFRLNIRETLAFFTGSRAKKEIRRIQEQGAEKTERTAGAGHPAVRTAGRPEDRTGEWKERSVEVKEPEPGQGEKTELLHTEEETAVLDGENEVDFQSTREVLVVHTDEVI